MNLPDDVKDSLAQSEHFRAFLAAIKEDQEAYLSKLLLDPSPACDGDAERHVVRFAEDILDYFEFQPNGK